MLSVPTKALRFVPNAEVLGEDCVIEDCEGNNKLWKHEGNAIKAYAVETGVTNGVRTEILSGANEGDSFILSMEIQSPDFGPQTAQRSPFMPGPRKQNKNKK